jgi:histidinol-phosphate aminotransferase
MNLFRTAKPHLASVKNYVPGKPLEELQRELGITNAVKMASNENALGPSPKAMAAVKKALEKAHRYPEGGCHYLRQRVSKDLSVSPDQLVFGNGSDELLVLAVRAFAGAGDEIVTADPTFLIYGIAATVENARVKKVPMKDFRYDLKGMLAQIGPKTKIVFIANPDNPVGTYVAARPLEDFMKKVPAHVLVVVDEAYFEFAAVKKDYPDSVKLLKHFENLAVTRTFSKAYGLAGLRIGYSVSSPEIAAALNKVREPFNVNSLAQAAALAALDDQAFLKKSVATVNEGRAFLTKSLEKMGFETVDTVTNFILFDLKRDASSVYEKLLRSGVIVRPMGSWGLKTFLRVTIGKKADNQRFLAALKKAVAKH